jgi:16S rRNA (guanine527-N7)-methyltransferase
MPTFGRAWFREHIEQYVPEVALSEDQISSLFRHFELLRHWNERMNLTSVDAPPEIVSRHYCESLFFASNMPDAQAGETVLDFGSGAGFPGLPLAVLRPESKITLLEANQRRAVFLKEASRGLPNIAVASERGESFASPHDWVVARAVKPVDVLRSLPRLGRKIGLLIGDTSMPVLERSHFRWSQTLKIPWSDRRFCVYGECSTWNVSGKLEARVIRD